MSKDIKKALEHCVEWNCDNCPNREELGSGETVCRGRLLPEVLEYVADLEAKLAESEKNYKDARELGIEQFHSLKEIINSSQEEIDKLKQQLAEKEKEIESLRENSLSKRIFKEKLIPSHCMEQYEKYEQQIDKLTQDKISFAVEQLEKFKASIENADNNNDIYIRVNYFEVIDEIFYNQINELKGKVEE